MRSPYEGLVYYVLEARKETRRRFRTTQRVAKVMGRGSHEIGLIAEDVRLTIEIDGEQHRTLTQTRRAASVRDYCFGKSTHFCSDVDIPLSEDSGGGLRSSSHFKEYGFRVVNWGLYHIWTPACLSSLSAPYRLLRRIIGENR
ncbi:MAG: hypothetical protein WBE80_05050 [Methylocella sp.]